MLLFLMFLSGAAWGEAEVVLYITQPWIAVATVFIGGANVSIIPLMDWSAEGDLVPADRGRVLRALTAESRIIALDEADARTVGLTRAAYPNLRFLYDRFPAVDGREVALSDPAVLPFMAQKVLVVLAEWDPMNYPYYQRRLAEFQSRLFGAVLAGQQVLAGSVVYDLSGGSGMLLRAAGCKVRGPEPVEREEWTRGHFAGLREALEALRAEGVTVVADKVTPKPLLKFLSSQPGVFVFDRPPLDRDYPLFLHQQYLALWQRISAKPQGGEADSPVKKPR